ncbi:MAG: hypothetical protein M5U08_02825 [Burkholderiales bacterium]|nr:hypothetical protein [Burkholderiales bacterium]
MVERHDHRAGIGDARDRARHRQGRAARRRAGGPDGQRKLWRRHLARSDAAPLAAADPQNDIAFVEDAFIPIAFAAWDGSNGENGSRHTLTTWYWLMLEPPRSSRPLVAAFAVLLLVAGGEAWWARSAARRSSRAGGGA